MTSTAPTVEEINIGERPTSATLKGYVALSDDGCAYLISHEGDDLDLFDGLGDDLSEKGLIVPEGLECGVYYCTNFYACDFEKDWESGIVDGWSVACEWKPVWNARQGKE
jgi:hypothetical protein